MGISRAVKRGAKKLLGHLLPIRKKIVFINFNGRGYGCNPKYIAEELLSRKLPYDMVWLVSNMAEVLPPQIRKVSIYHWRARLELLTAKLWISNVRNDKGVEKRKGQYYIQTWHSSIALKKVEGDIKDFPEEKKRESQHDGRITDLMFANNDFRAAQIRRAFWYEGPILKCGVPRNAILFHDAAEVRRKVCRQFDIAEDAAIILYAPTFRAHKDTTVYLWDYRRICAAVEERTGEKTVMLLRLHPNVSEESAELRFDKQVKNASHYPDMQELLAAADCLITDFSGCAFDFSFAYKPVFLFAKDKNTYLAQERELLMEVDELPFAFAESEEALAGIIRHFDEAQYRGKCEEFFERIGLQEAGNGARVIADWIEEKMEA